MEEIIYYKDDHVKITDLRMTCNHITFPIKNINNITVDFKVATLTAVGTLFLLSLIAIPLLCYFYGCFALCGIIVLLACFVWLRIIYLTYTELKVSTGNKKYKILNASMYNREYIFKIEEVLKAVITEKSGENLNFEL